MNKPTLLLVLGLSFFFLSCANKQLTTQQKTDDFLYLFDAMEANFPYFGVAQRKQGVDWLGKKNEYIERIQATENDSAYIYELSNILGELREGHTDLAPVVMWHYFLDAYKGIAKEMPEYKIWSKTMKKSTPRIEYWAQIINKDTEENDSHQSDVKPLESEYKDTIMPDQNVAIMHIPSFLSSYMSIDEPKINHFLNSISEVDNLIIDVQGNGGGATDYWSNLIVSRLTEDTITFSQYYAIKDGALNRKFFPDDFNDKKLLDIHNSFFSKIPEEFKNGKYNIIDKVEKIAPDNPVPFNGKIYLLVDHTVFSSSEAFAYFCKTTKWAQVAGQPTRGDGIGSDPILILLPESHIVARTTVTAGFNDDGNINTEKGTMPDIIIEGDTKEERLNNLIKRIAF
ncbi:hypothetical protein D0T49_08645 [Paludibacter sp. 221]|uniref:S41 family peptidase n=1 Tax=Paludibacter sp. 221 TaxID=2302939 RepID=UPI0013D2C768|nr:S41 family peptidase [Paludibacter sp. 221]NDV47112.1 hypothetical protein [Paludibacter sp. 221]